MERNYKFNLNVLLKKDSTPDKRHYVRNYTHGQKEENLLRSHKKNEAVFQ